MIYRIDVKNIKDYDIPLLRKEIESRVGKVSAIHAGNGALLIDMPGQLSPAELIKLRAVLRDHSPIWFEWKESGRVKRESVQCAEDVDRVTAHRIRQLMPADEEPIQGQIKILTETLHGIISCVSEAGTLSDMRKSLALLSAHNDFFARREAILTDGKNFKKNRGW